MEVEGLMFAAHRMTPFIAPKLRKSVLVSGGLKGIKEAITCCLGPKIRRGLLWPFESSCNEAESQSCEGGLVLANALRLLLIDRRNSGHC